MARLARQSLALSALFALACVSRPTAPPPPWAERATVVHTVARGETIWRISRRYGVSVYSIIDANDIDDVTDVPTGARLVIPDARVDPDPVLALLPPSSSPEARPAPTDVELRFAWPLRGKVSSGFGRRNGRRHAGIDVRARSGTQIRATEAGRVIQSGRLRGYGKIVVVKHLGPYTSVYAHNRKNLVRSGDFVEQGQVIAEVGATGNATGPHLHFEIRRGRGALDPLLHLPTR